MKNLIDRMLSNLGVLFRVIPQKLRREYLWISSLSIFLAFTEFLGVAALIPFFNEVTNAPGLTYVKICNRIFSLDLHFDPIESIVFSLSIIVVLLIIKNCVSTLVLFKQYRFGSKIQAGISEEMLSNYLMKPYIEIVNRNSSDLIRNSIQEANKLNEYIVLPSFFLVTDFLLSAAILLFLFISEPVSSIILFSAIGLFYGLSVFFIGRKITRWGKLRFAAEGQRVQMVQEGLGAIIDIKLRGSVLNYLKKYSKPNLESATYAILQNATQQVPRYLLEVFIFLSLLIMVVINSSLIRFTNSDLLGVLGLFAISSYKLLPTINRITNIIQSIRFYKPSMEAFDEINGDQLPAKTDTAKVRRQTFEKFEIQNLDLSYNDNHVLKNINISLNKGETIGIIGKSGSGKTSLVHCMLGLIKPSTGKILVDGFEVNNEREDWGSLIGYVPQTVFLLDATIQDNIALNFDNAEVDTQRLRLVVTQAGLSDWIDSLPNGFNSKVGERGSKISGGQLQRIGIARALYRNPAIIIFDESTSALDSKTEKQFLSTLESLKNEKTIIFITHKTAPLEICTKILHIKNGSIDV